MDKNNAASVDAKQRTKRSKRTSSRRTERKRDILNSLVDNAIDRLLSEDLENVNPQINSVFEPTVTSNDLSSLPGRNCSLDVCQQQNTPLSEFNAGEKGTSSKHLTGRVSSHLPVVDKDHNDLTLQSTGTGGYFSQSTRSMDSTENSTVLGGSETSAFFESTSLGIPEEKRRKKTGKKRRLTNRLDLLLDEHGFLSGDVIPEVQSRSDTGAEIDVTVGTVCSADGAGVGLGGRESCEATERTASTPPPAKSAVRSSSILDKCDLEKSAKKNAVTSSGLKSKTPITTFAGILKSNDRLLEDGGIQHDSGGMNVKSFPRLQKTNNASHLFGKNQNKMAVSSDGVAATVAVDLRFKDASVQAEASHSDASVQVDLCQCRNYLQSTGSWKTRGTALDHENLTGTLAGNSRDPVVRHLSSSTDSSAKEGSSTPFGRPSLYVSAFENLPVSSAASASTVSPVMQNFSLQVSMSADEGSYCGNLGPTVDTGKEMPNARNMKDSVGLNESHDSDCCRGGQLKQANTAECSEDVNAEDSDYNGSTLSPIMQNFSLQVSMSADEFSNCGNLKRDLPTTGSEKEMSNARKMEDLIDMNESSHGSDHCHGGQLNQAKTVEYSEDVNAKNSASNDTNTRGQISNETHKLDRARTFFVLTDDDETPEKSNLVSRDRPLDDEDSSFSSEVMIDRRVTGRVMQSTFLDRDDRATGLLSSEHIHLPGSPIESGLPMERRQRSRGWKRVSMCAMNFEECRKRSTRNDSDQSPGSLSVVPDSDESFKSAVDHHHDTADAKALENVSRVSESDSSDGEFEKFLTAAKTVRKERRSIVPMSKFIVDECEDNNDLDSDETDDDVEEETESDRDDDDDDGDGRKAIVVSSDDELFNNKGCSKNDQSHDVVKELSERLKALLSSSDDGDDFSSLYYSTKKEIGKKDILPVSSTVKDGGKNVEPERTLKFRAPDPFVSSRDRVVSANTPRGPLVAVHLGQLPYTVGHAAPVRNGFLRSLDPQVKDHLRDFNAARFVNSFKSLRNELTVELFSLYNKRVFDMKIPSDTKVVWNDRMRTTAGWCSYRTTKEVPAKRYVQIELSVKVCNSPDRVRDTLIHEMCHAKVWIEYGIKECHGRMWKNWAQVANNVLPELPRITVCHNYTITTKYVYRCTRCGSRVGRHSKSLDINKFFCKFCFGPFELLVQSQSGAENVFKTPRPPNQFAQFVKENYSEVKKTTPGSTHSEIMKLIGQRYSAKKSAPVSGGQKLDFSE